MALRNYTTPDVTEKLFQAKEAYSCSAETDPTPAQMEKRCSISSSQQLILGKHCYWITNYTTMPEYEGETLTAKFYHINLVYVPLK